jgi:hypothetical protein
MTGEASMGSSIGRPSAGQRLVWIGGAVIAAVAAAAAAVLAVVFAATVVVIAVVSTALFGLIALVLRARRPAKAKADDGIIEARHVGGHSWVAYGWDKRKP